MAQYIFGAGNMYVTQKLDATGATVSNPTPVPLMTLQEGSIDISADVKKLYGQNQYPVAVGRGKGSVSVKVKPARVFASTWNTLFFGESLSDGIIAAYTDTVGKTIPASSTYTVVITPPSSGTFVADLGVISSTTGLPWKRVASSPSAGQYSVDVSTATYTFASADASAVVYINFQYTTSSAANGQKQASKNLPMGYAPFFSAILTVSYAGKLTTFNFRNAIATKMAVGVKNEDFAVPEFSFDAMDDGTGYIMDWSTSE